MKVLVTGCAGFIGSTLSRQLLDDGYDVVGIDAMTDYYPESLKQQNIAWIDRKNFTFIRGDLNHIDLNSILSDIAVVFHQAGQPGVRKSWGSEFDHYTDNNIRATQTLLEAVVASKRPARVVYASSSSVYGDAERYPTTEADLPRPASPYGVTKLAAEHLCNLYAQNFGIETIALRYFTVFGPRQRPDMAFTRFTRAALNQTRITVNGSGDQIRDFTYVEDVVDANLRAARIPAPRHPVFNISGGTSVSVNQVLDIISELSGRELLIDRGPTVHGDVHQTGGDAHRARLELGWEPKISLREGLGMQLDWAASL